ncbi:hypothetical protein WN48_07338 [Eufriesea mexicana]|nr:hypothetical protein WN48_07338 [Eufriesea mexicana]
MTYDVCCSVCWETVILARDEGEGKTLFVLLEDEAKVGDSNEARRKLCRRR